ncbi:MAG: hypothetical protein AB1540_10285 [Bdellovibrionota bacterium]
MVTRRTYKIDPITVNGVQVVEVIIDPHYEQKHSDHIDDPLLLRLVKKLDGRFELPETKSGAYSYFATLIELESKQYRLIWLLEGGAIYVGVVNAFRDRKKG